MSFMASVLPLVKQTITRWQPEQIASFTGYEHGQQASLLLIERIRLSLEELSGAARDDAQGKIPRMRAVPLHMRHFSFSDITYLASKSMVLLGVTPESGVPDEAEHQAIVGDLLKVAPLVCGAFNGVVALLNLPYQRGDSAPCAPAHADIPSPRNPMPIYNPDHHTR